MSVSTELARDVSVLNVVERSVSVDVARDVSVDKLLEMSVSVNIARDVSVLNVVERRVSVDKLLEMSVSMDIARDISVDKLVERSVSAEVARDVSVDKLLEMLSMVTPVNTPLTSAIISLGVTAICPVEPPLASVVPNVKRSFASSHPINTFADVSRYINIPESFIAPFVNPLFKLIKLSEISKLVVLIVVVIPFTVKSPLINTLLSVVIPPVTDRLSSINTFCVI